MYEVPAEEPVPKVHPIAFVEGLGVAVKLGIGSPRQNFKGPAGTTSGRGNPFVTFILKVPIAEQPLLLETITV